MSLNIIYLVDLITTKRSVAVDKHTKHGRLPCLKRVNTNIPLGFYKENGRGLVRQERASAWPLCCLVLHQTVADSILVTVIPPRLHASML
jgi:hypothetical protein